ncbi:putative reverse transcriptase zinc-binding domain-containing protein [Helianthus annuus]|nr:putative reverse transcriptase zinc-binding domain-containing protein [Helianthus annuus]KAJ0767121.1 putative reverse transcriptase zinc-binding domain-containing protein [Helianthus annuus]
MLLLLSAVSTTYGADSWTAKFIGSGCFKVSSVKKLIIEATCVIPEASYEWCNWVPRKVGIVAWRAFLDRLPTADALSRRNIHVETPYCRICDTNMESVDHLFTGCPVSMEVWQVVFAWCRVPNLFAFHVLDLLNYYKIEITNVRAKKAFYGVVLTTFWSLWKARNDLIHNQKAVVVRNVFEEIKIMSYLWITNRGKMSDMTVGLLG